MGNVINNKLPNPKKVAKILEKNQDHRIDNYYWMKQLENQEVMEHLRRENEYVEEVMKHTNALQGLIFREIIGRIKQNDDSVPYLKNGYWYFYKYKTGYEHPVYYRKKDGTTNQELLLDAESRSKNFPFYQVGGMSISPDNQWLLFGEDTVGRRKYSLKLKNITTGKIGSLNIENTSGYGVWNFDGSSFYYVKKDETLRPSLVYLHILNTPSSSDHLIYEEKDAAFYTSVAKTKSEKFIFIINRSNNSDEYMYISDNQAQLSFKLLEKRSENHEYSAFHHGGYFYILSNWKAQNFRIMRTPVLHTDRGHWQEVIPESRFVFIEDADITRKYLMYIIRRDANVELCIYNLDKKQVENVELSKEPRLLEFNINVEFDTDQLRYTLSTLKTPTQQWEYNMASKQHNLLKEQEVVGGYDSELYQSERIWASSKDGERVPVSIVYRKDLFNSGENPCLLYGYGSYGISIDPYFSISRLSLVDRGFVFAIAHIRGGQELGRRWYDQGKKLYKKNTFQDFIACTEALVQAGYAHPKKICAMGGSAGGMLMGTILNWRPDLYCAVVAAVPFVDVLTTMLDESIPLTVGEYEEWGNPNKPEYYRYIKSYSPYDNIHNTNYPALLVTTGLHDSQVQYWEPAKWVAKLRDFNQSDSPILFYINLKAGHSGSSGRFERFKETALQYAFLIDQTKDQ